SIKGIAARWAMHRETVRSKVTALLVKRAIFPTKKRRGDTGQIKVYRMPKFLWQRGASTASLKEDKEAQKRRQRGKKEAPKPPRIMNNEEEEHHDVTLTIDNSIPSASNKGSPSVFVSKGHQHQQGQNQSAKAHIKWPEYVAYCASQKGK